MCASWPIWLWRYDLIISLHCAWVNLQSACPCIWLLCGATTTYGHIKSIKSRAHATFAMRYKNLRPNLKNQLLYSEWRRWNRLDIVCNTQFAMDVGSLWEARVHTALRAHLNENDSHHSQSARESIHLFIYLCEYFFKLECHTRRYTFLFSPKLTSAQFRNPHFDCLASAGWFWRWR